MNEQFVSLLNQVDTCITVEELLKLVPNLDKFDSHLSTLLQWVARTKYVNLLQRTGYQVILASHLNALGIKENEQFFNPLIDEIQWSWLQRKYGLQSNTEELIVELSLMEYQQRVKIIGELITLCRWNGATRLRFLELMEPLESLLQSGMNQKSNSRFNLGPYLADRLSVKTPLSLRAELGKHRIADNEEVEEDDDEGDGDGDGDGDEDEEKDTPAHLKQRINRIMQLMIKRRQGETIDTATFQELARYQEFQRQESFDELETFCFEQLSFL